MFADWSLGRKIAAALALGPITLIAISVLGLTSLQYGTDRQAAVNALVFGTIAAVAVLILVALAVIRSANRPVEAAVGKLTKATSQILALTSQQVSGVREQAAAVAETVSTIEEIARTAATSKDGAKSVAETAYRAAENGIAGHRAIEETVSVMAELKDRSASLGISVEAVAGHAREIREIIGVVGELAERTNFLAMNAAIEATRAGEHGRGFSVVAAEIKALADQSKAATINVQRMLKDVERAIADAVSATQENARTVERVIQSTTEADRAIGTLAVVASDAAQAAAQIGAAVSQQSIGINQIQQAMQAISDSSSQTLSATDHAERTARDLDGLGSSLRKLVHGSDIG